MAKKSKVRSSNKSFSTGGAISYGWNMTTKNLKFFVVLFLIMIAVNAVPSIIIAILDHEKAEMLSFLVQIVSWVLQVVIGIGAINVALKLYDKKKTKYSDLFQNFNLVIPYFLATIIYGIVVLVGIILFIIPGIIWGIKFQYFPYFMVDRGMGPIDALKASAKLTEGVKWQLFFFGILIALINIIGFLCLLIGLFITAPLGMMAQAYAYRKLSGK